MKQRVAALGLMLALVGAGAAAQEKMSLREAVDLVLKNNQQVQIAAENAAAAPAARARVRRIVRDRRAWLATDARISARI